ncbi:MAG: PfkB family carbohydrate kinase [Bacteroidota bacterium]
MEQVKIVQNALDKLSNYKDSKHLLVGFDGFVDEIIHVVDKRKNHKEYERISDIGSYADRIAKTAGLSANIELVPIQTKIGGNGPIMANAVISQGNKVTYIGALGESQINPIFQEFAKACENVYSLTDPGHTDALEFYDGKIMMGKMNNLVDINLDNLLKILPKPELEKLLANVDLLAFTNWTMLSNLNTILEEFSKIVEVQMKKPLVFIDLADPKKRTKEDIQEILNIISGYKTDTVLSMNMSESSIISEVLDLREEKIVERAVKIREKMNIFGIVIHPTNGAAISTAVQSGWVDGPYTSEPKLTTGAGDNFNAGFCNAWLAGLEPIESVAVGVCSSGFYVRNERSATRADLQTFMKQWVDVDCGDI